MIADLRYLLKNIHFLAICTLDAYTPQILVATIILTKISLLFLNLVKNVVLHFSTRLVILVNFSVFKDFQ